MWVKNYAWNLMWVTAVAGKLSISLGEAKMYN
jgi:hypothetical protein